MSDTTITPATTADPVEVVTAALAAHPNGTTTTELADATGLSRQAVTAALRGIEATGGAVRTPATGSGKNRTPDRWTPVPTDPTDDPSGDTPTDDADAPNGDASADEEATNGDDEEAPVSPAFAGPDPRVLLVATALAGARNGLTARDVSEKSGLRAGVATKVLEGMAAAGCARTGDKTTNGGAGAEDRWYLNAGVDMAALMNVTVLDGPVMCTCECGHTHKKGTPGTGAARTRPTTPGLNSDGQRKLRPGELKDMVLTFVNDHPGMDLTAGIIAREITRSSGAVSNALTSLADEGLVTTDATGRHYTALDTGDTGDEAGDADPTDDATDDSANEADTATGTDEAGADEATD